MNSVATVPGWRDDLAAWCAEFAVLLSRDWDCAVASALFERIEVQASLTEMVAEPALAEAAAELTVYLCTFAESDIKPDVEQRMRLDRLGLSLQRAVVPLVGVQEEARAERTAQGRKFRVHYLRPPASEQRGLAAALGQLKMAVHPIDDVETALQTLAREQPDVVILEASMLRALPALSEAARRHNAGNWRRVLWAAIGVENDLQLRLYARRAGIDLLLETESPERAGAALLAALLRRREEAYRILIVEDDHSQAAFSSALLRHQGFAVDIAETAAQALEQLKVHVPDLVLLDVHLPDMIGVELAQLIREQDSLAHVPIVFLTGEEDMDLRAEAIAAGGDDFLSKPVRPRHLIANVNSRIGRARALASAAQAEPIEESLSPRLDRVRFVEALEGRRNESSRCVAVAVVAMEDVGGVASRLGFVRTGDLALQIALAIEVEAREAGPSCGIGEFSRLVLVEAETEFGLRKAVESLCAKLDGRGWLSSTFPLRLRFSAGVARYDGSPLNADAIIAAALEQLDAQRAEKGARVGFRNLVAIEGGEEDPLRRIARVLLAKPLTTSSGRLQFRPLLPLRGTRSGQFLLRTVLLPPGSRRATGIPPETYDDVAGAMGVHAGLDKLSLQLVAHYSRSALVAKQGWTVLMPVSDHSLQEPFFAEWLQRVGVDASQLLLVVRATRLRAGSGLAAALDRLASRGWHWVLQVDEPEQFERGVLTIGNLDAVMLDQFAAEPARWAAVASEAQSHGKSVIATGLDEVRQVGSLFTSGAHYAIGEAAGAWADEPVFEATRPREL